MKKINVTYRIVKAGSTKVFTSDIVIKNAAIVQKISNTSFSIRALSADNHVVGEPIKIELEGDIFEITGIEV